MTKKLKSDNDISAMMNKIQGQLAVLDRKLDSFMTKSLTELAQALAASKPAPRPQVQNYVAPRPPQNNNPHQRQMYAVVCFECGQDTEIPFKPSGTRPVYCKECFAKRKGRPAPVLPAQPLSVTPAAVSVAPSTKTKAPAGKPAKAKNKTAKKPAAKKKLAKKR